MSCQALSLLHRQMQLALCKSLRAMQVKERASKAEPTVKQVKILKDADKAGEAKAKSAKSKGFAFVELTDHEHALCALRQLNNNPVPFGAMLSAGTASTDTTLCKRMLYLCLTSSYCVL